jgi:hypothetical protein
MALDFPMAADNEMIIILIEVQFVSKILIAVGINCSRDMANYRHNESKGHTGYGKEDPFPILEEKAAQNQTDEALNVLSQVSGSTPLSSWRTWTLW